MVSNITAEGGNVRINMSHTLIKKLVDAFNAGERARFSHWIGGERSWSLAKNRHRTKGSILALLVGGGRSYKSANFWGN